MRRARPRRRCSRCAGRSRRPAAGRSRRHARRAPLRPATASPATAPTARPDADRSERALRAQGQQRVARRCGRRRARGRLLPAHRLHAARATPAMQPRRTPRAALRAARSRRSSPTSRRSGTGPPIPRAAARARQPLGRACTCSPTHCAGCHQIVAAGRLRDRRASRRRSRDATPTQIAEAVRIGPYVMPRFSTAADLGPRSSTRSSRYVEYAKHPDDRGGWAIGHVGPVPEGLVTWFLAASSLVGGLHRDREEAAAVA